MTNRFEYDITKHPAEEFTQLVFYCTEAGQCNLDRVPHEQTAAVKTILNDRGKEGWEAFHLVFGKDGLVVFWKRLLG